MVGVKITRGIFTPGSQDAKGVKINCNTDAHLLQVLHQAARKFATFSLTADRIIWMSLMLLKWCAAKQIFSWIELKLRLQENNKPQTFYTVRNNDTLRNLIMTFEGNDNATSDNQGNETQSFRTKNKYITIFRIKFLLKTLFRHQRSKVDKVHI